MIRDATRDDLLAILRMGREFATAIGEAYDRESIVQTCEWLMDDAECTLKVYENGAVHGMAGAVIVPMFIDRKRKQATELFWWVDADHRRGGAGAQLLNGLESWAFEAGADRLSMMAMQVLDSGVGELYERFGYEVTETTYLKEF